MTDGQLVILLAVLGTLGLLAIYFLLSKFEKKPSKG